MPSARSTQAHSWRGPGSSSTTRTRQVRSARRRTECVTTRPADGEELESERRQQQGMKPDRPRDQNRGHDVEDLVGKRPSHGAQDPLAHVDRYGNRKREPHARSRQHAGLGGEAPTEQTPAGGICRVRLFVCMDGAARIGAPAQSVTTGPDRLRPAAHRTAGRRLRPSTRARAVRWCSSTPSLWNPPYLRWNAIRIV